MLTEISVAKCSSVCSSTYFFLPIFINHCFHVSSSKANRLQRSFSLIVLRSGGKTPHFKMEMPHVSKIYFYIGAPKLTEISVAKCSSVCSSTYFFIPIFINHCLHVSSSKANRLQRSFSLTVLRSGGKTPHFKM